jgi:hypothetical protein
MLDSSESPNDDDACSSSLASILETNVDPKYFLSARAAQGILKRSKERNRKLPPLLHGALESLAQTTIKPKQDI